MKGHPGGLNRTQSLLAQSGLAPGARILDMGAGDGTAVRFLRQQGFQAVGIDLAGSADVLTGDFLHAPFQAETFDAVLGECSFFLSGHVPQALAEAWRLLKYGGTFLYADVCFQELAGLTALLERTGFIVVDVQDLTADWRDYYFECLWSGWDGELPCAVPPGKTCRYYQVICRKE